MKQGRLCSGLVFFAAISAWADDSAARGNNQQSLYAFPPAAITASVAEPVVVNDEALFPHLPILKPNVEFWTKVFAQYSEYQSVIHSADDPDKVFTVLDFRQQAAVLDPARVRSLLGQAEKREKKYYDRLLRSVHKKRSTPKLLTQDERRLYEMFADSDDPQRFKRAADGVRAQRGLKERTARALETAGKYLPAMEAVFESYRLPKRLTRLPLVESSFNVEAYSKVGAAGIWQFMPSSARIYMRLDEVVDDRADPWFSTEGAARHLKDDYDALQSWPLAITAYNHGRGGVAGGLRKVQGDGLEDLIARYRSRQFGFASRNFYAEFLAASDIERDYRKHFGDVARKEPLRFDTVQTGDYVAYETLRRLSGMDEDTFSRFNPAYRPDVIEGKLHVPPGHTIRIPAGQSETFRVAYAALAPSERYEQQKLYYVQHRVRKGDTLGRIAKRYGVSVSSVRGVNIGIGKKLKVGQIVRVPPRGASPATVVAAAKPIQNAEVSSAGTVEVATGATEAAPAKAQKTTKKTAGPRTHRVRSGQTLSHIAKRYRVSVNSLRQANGLGSSSHIKPGQRLKIPN